MRLLIRLVITIAAAVATATLVFSARAYAGEVQPQCNGTACDVGVNTPGAPGSQSPTGPQTASDPNPGANQGSASGPCPAGQTPSYETQTQGGQPVTAQPGDVNPITLQLVAPGSTLEVISCNGNYLTTVVVPPGGATGPAAAGVTGAALARQAFARFQVAAPSPRLSPATAVVNYPTWLWLQGGWATQSATASVPGLSATVTAAPVRVVWSMGDGGQVVCDGPGVAWNSSEPNASTYCSYTYPAAGQFTATVTVYYGASWTATDGTAGRLGAVTGRTTFAVAVDEIQTVNN